MKRLFDFCCDDCGETFEKLVSANLHKIECQCGGMAKRQISMPRVSLDGTDPGFPGAYDKWARVREEKARVSLGKSYYEG